MLNAMTSLVSLAVGSVSSFLLVRVILLNMGSDYNGLNSTVSQLLAVLMIVEGSFTNASQVALYKPLAENDDDTFNIICSTTSRFYKISSIVMLLTGAVFALSFAGYVKTAYDYYAVFAVIAIAVISSSASTAIAGRYRVLFQVTQNEYIITGIQVFFTIISALSAYLVVVQGGGIIILRLSYTFFSILLSFTIFLTGRVQFRHIQFNKKSDFKLIKGTSDVIISVSTGMVYKSAPVFYLSTFSGTVFTSVYAIYYSIIQIVESVLNAILNAPKNGIGQLLADNNGMTTKKVLHEYELTTIASSSILLSVTYAVIMPFIMMYTRGVTDAVYRDDLTAAMLMIGTFVMFIHVPSGTCINMGGHFRTMRNNQIIGLVVLLISIIALSSFFGIHGILAANIVTGIVLAVLEITFAHQHIVPGSAKKSASMIIVNFVVGCVLSLGEKTIVSTYITSYLRFFFVSASLLLINALIICTINYAIYGDIMRSTLRRILNNVRMRTK